MGLTCDVGDSNHVMFWHDKFKVSYPENSLEERSIFEIVVSVHRQNFFFQGVLNWILPKRKHCYFIVSGKHPKRKGGLDDEVATNIYRDGTKSTG